MRHSDGLINVVFIYIYKHIDYCFLNVY